MGKHRFRCSVGGSTQLTRAATKRIDRHKREASFRCQWVRHEPQCITARRMTLAKSWSCHSR